MSPDPGQVARLEGWAIAIDAALERCPHLTGPELIFAEHWLALDPSTVEGPCTGMIIGEMPGARTSKQLPMFPYPAGSAGGRLWRYSHIPLGPYLARLYRINLVPDYRVVWPTGLARTRADEVVARLGPLGARVVLCGARVLSAFTYGRAVRTFERFELLGSTYVGIPHPSGRNPAMNAPDVRRQVRRTVQWAAGWSPEEKED